MRNFVHLSSSLPLALDKISSNMSPLIFSITTNTYKITQCVKTKYALQLTNQTEVITLPGNGSLWLNLTNSEKDGQYSQKLEATPGSYRSQNIQGGLRTIQQFSRVVSLRIACEIFLGFFFMAVRNMVASYCI